MVGHGGSSAGSYLADPTFPIPFTVASIAVTSTVGVNYEKVHSAVCHKYVYYVSSLTAQ